MSRPKKALAYFAGRLVWERQAALPWHDAGFVYGATVTDRCRTFRHQLYRLPDHLARFRRSCQSACIPQPLTDDELTASAQALVHNNSQLLRPEQDLALVIYATPGPIGYHAGQAGGPGVAPPTLCLYTFPLSFHRYARLFREGARLVVPATRQVPAECIDPRIKQRSRMHWWIAEQEAHQVDPEANALLLDVRGQVTETATANFLIVRGGTVYAPPSGTVLEGISLLTVRELCDEQGIRFEERPLGLDDCLTADEALLTSTPYGVAGVSRINGVAIPWPGPVLQRLLDAWSKRVGLDIRSQIECGSS